MGRWINAHFYRIHEAIRSELSEIPHTQFEDAVMHHSRIEGRIFETFQPP